MQYNSKDVTNQKSTKRIILKSEQLSDASEQALLEAGKWMDAICVLEKSKQPFDLQICILALFSIELYLKAILMKKGKQEGGHDLKNSTMLYIKLNRWL